MTDSWTLAELISACDGAVNARTVRFWITEGLVPPPSGGRGAHARYGTRHAARIAEVRRLQNLGLSLANIGLLLGDTAEEPAPPGDPFWLQRAGTTVIELAPGLRVQVDSPLDPVRRAALVTAATELVATYRTLLDPARSNHAH